MQRYMRGLGILSVGLSLAAAAMPAAAGDMAVRLRVLDPKQGEDWDSAGGAEMQARFWRESGLGLALAIGYESWDARGDFLESQDALGYYSTAIEGSAALFPIGASLLFRTPLMKGVDLTLEAGLRYVFADSDIAATVYVTDATGAVWYRDPIEIGNAVIGLLALHVEADITEHLALQAGVGYQADLSSPEETYLGEDIGETSLEAAAFHIGLVWDF